MPIGLRFTDAKGPCTASSRVMEITDRELAMHRSLFILTTRTVIRCHANSSELRATSDLGLAFLQSLKPRLYTKTTVSGQVLEDFAFWRQISADFHEIPHFGAFPNIFGSFLEQKVVTVTILLNCWGC